MANSIGILQALFGDLIEAGGDKKTMVHCQDGKACMDRVGGITRRTLLKTAATTVLAPATPAVIPSSALGMDGQIAPSNRIGIGFIGLGTEGRLKNLKKFMAIPEVQVVALCDVHPKRLHSAHIAMQGYAQKPSRACTVRVLSPGLAEIVARKDIDAVVISTPDHWHALMAIAAARAGKDVFCEKPVAHTVQEGRTVSDAMRTLGRIYQTGSENRSLRPMLRACELVRNGYIGPLERIRVEILRGFEPELPDMNPS